jgi:hypothetical protein
MFSSDSRSETFTVVGPFAGDLLEDGLTYQEAVELVNERADTYADLGFDTERHWASADNLYCVHIVAREDGREGFIAVERDR